jgi:RNA polymerase-binding transcription factor DksA
MAKKKPAPAKKPAKKAPQQITKAKSASNPPKKEPVAASPAKPSIVKKDSKPAPAPQTAAKAAAKASARDDLRSRVLARATKVGKPLAFSLEEAREIAKVISVKNDAAAQDQKAASKTHTNGKKDVTADKPAQPHLVKAASLADILGFNPKKTSNPGVENDEDVPEKFRRYYKLLIELRDHVTGQLDQHTEETLKRSAKDDAGDLSSYGQHMADSGTDTFDRDFALSLVSNEQEALSEIDAAIQRIKAGTYGICEVTTKPIAKERLLAVPFTRYSAEAQKEIEKNRYRSRQQAGLFGELGEDGAKIADEEAGAGGED